jgi:hypothetical protein
MKEILVFVAVIFAIIGNIPYLRDVLKRKVEPHPYTWLVWSVVSLIMFFGQLSKGAGIGAIPTGASEVFTILIFIFSLRYGFKHIVRRDTYFLILALLGLIPWALTNDPTVSVVIVVGIDLIAFIPTLRKARDFPSTENPILYEMNVARHILTLFSLEAHNIATMLHSVAMVLVNSLMSFLLLRKSRVKI